MGAEPRRGHQPLVGPAIHADGVEPELRQAGRHRTAGQPPAVPGTVHHARRSTLPVLAIDNFANEAAVSVRRTAAFFLETPAIVDSDEFSPTRWTSHRGTAVGRPA